MGRGAEPSGVHHGFALLAQCAAGDDVVSAELCHDVAVLLERLGELTVAESFHRRAGLLLVALPTGQDADRHRIRWARSLAANLVAQHRRDEAAEVLRAAVALSEGLLGAEDIETTETALALDELLASPAR